MISVRRSAGRERGYCGSTPSSRLRSRASRIARNLRLIESLWRYGIEVTLARFGCNLTRSVYLTLGVNSTQRGKGGTQMLWPKWLKRGGTSDGRLYCWSWGLNCLNIIFQAKSVKKAFLAPG